MTGEKNHRIPEKVDVDLSRLRVVIPALNAEHQLPGVIAGCLDLGQKWKELIIVIDDGSSDETSRVARAAGVRVVRHERNMGKGEALRTGFELALRDRVDAVVTMDADGQHLASEIPKLLQEWKQSGADLVIGSRDHLFGDMVGRRRLANRFSARSISMFAGVRVRDSQSGFRLYTRRFLTEVDYESSGFAAESEMVVVSGRKGLAISETSIRLGFVDAPLEDQEREDLVNLAVNGEVSEP
ncbi:MAG: glycosyltransferase family 2 protein, partial [Acidobacteria bacterium]|nr:glycosyltransferase family 2 protein [Acidobacteriota bacterium]